MNRIYGLNSVASALESGLAKTLYVSKEFKKSEILSQAKKQGVLIKEISDQDLNSMFPKVNHQHIAAEIKPLNVYSLDEVLKESKNSDDYPICILDELTDPHNLGAILRSADIFGIKAIIYKKTNSVKLSPLVAKISSGGISYVKCVEVTNLSVAIKKLKENFYWVFGLDGLAKENIDSIYKDKKVCIVIGSEGKGISRLVRENCDLLVKIPQFGHVPCLNASNAAAIAFYELRRKIF